MAKAQLEHVNFTAQDPQRTARMLCDLFGWEVRWRGEAISGGYSVHVGTRDQYVAIYTGPGGAPQEPAQSSYSQRGGLNHIGVVVDDLDAVEAKVKDLGYEPVNHADYDPGRRFYFRDEDNIEFEVVSYA